MWLPRGEEGRRRGGSHCVPVIISEGVGGGRRARRGARGGPRGGGRPGREMETFRRGDDGVGGAGSGGTGKATRR